METAEGCCHFDIHEGHHGIVVHLNDADDWAGVEAFSKQVCLFLSEPGNGERRDSLLKRMCVSIKPERARLLAHTLLGVADEAER